MPNNASQPKKLLIADVPAATLSLAIALEEHYQLLQRTSWTGARAAAHQGIDLILCGTGFEESKMFDLLDYLRNQEETKATPLFCIKIIRQKLPSAVNDGIAIALHAKRTAGYIAFEGWQSCIGIEQAFAKLRMMISEALTIQNTQNLH